MQAKGILVALAAVFVAAECFLPFGQPQDLRRSYDEEPLDCLETTQQCALQLLNSGINRGSSFYLRDVVDNANQLCTSFQQAKECLSPVLENICVVDSQRRVNEYLAAGDFICSQSGRSLLEESRTSPCYSNSSLIDDARQASRACLTARVAAGLCVDATSVAECIETTTAEQCGESFGQFVAEAYAAATQSRSVCPIDN